MNQIMRQRGYLVVSLSDGKQQSFTEAVNGFAIESDIGRVIDYSVTHLTQMYVLKQMGETSGLSGIQMRELLQRLSDSRHKHTDREFLFIPLTEIQLF